MSNVITLALEGIYLRVVSNNIFCHLSLTLPYKSSLDSQKSQCFSGWWYPMAQGSESVRYQAVWNLHLISALLLYSDAAKTDSEGLVMMPQISAEALLEGHLE